MKSRNTNMVMMQYFYRLFMSDKNGIDKIKVFSNEDDKSTYLQQQGIKH
jgi:hypothetical protein